MHLDATTLASIWATIGLLIFIGGAVYLGLPKMIGKALDGRINKISEELDEANRLREEAQALLAEYERKRKGAEAEAADIVTAAKDEAKMLAEEAKVSLEEMIARRTKSVEDKIAQAEAQALIEVRSKSADVAIEAARVLLVDQMSEQGDALVDSAITEVASRLN